ncbi:MAG: efflux RND transporter periplasmic adaptor subunit [Planctomycetota bacterium]|nr:efflux RND transporter periplasmic adaptor subunit [Planctomycetota bacterium]
MNKAMVLVIGIALGAALMYGLATAGLAPIWPGPSPEEREHGREDDESGEEDPEEHEEHRGAVRLTEEGMRAARIRVESVEPRPISRNLETTAVVKLNEDHLVHITPRVSAKVESIAGVSAENSLVDCDTCRNSPPVKAVLGTDVEKGDILATLDSIDLGLAKAEYLRLREAVEIAKAHFEREERLLIKGTTSEKEMLDAKGEYLNTGALINSSRENLLLLGLSMNEIESLSWTHKERASHFHLRSPTAGRIIEKHATVGEVVDPGRILFTVADLSTVWILLDIYERDIPKVKDGQRALIRVEGYDAVFKGQVTYISDLVDEETRTAKARVEVKNPDRKLKPGMFVHATLAEEDGRDPAILLPQDAIQQIEGSPVVFVATAARTFEPRAIEIGERFGGKVVIVSGLEAGEEVVVEGAFWLKSELSRGELGGGHSH